MGDCRRVPPERAVRCKEVVAERESAPRDLRVARGFRRRPRVAFPRAGAERRPMLSSRRRFARWAARRVRGAQERGRLAYVPRWCACASATPPRHRAEGLKGASHAGDSPPGALRGLEPGLQKWPGDTSRGLWESVTRPKADRAEGAGRAEGAAF